MLDGELVATSRILLAANAAAMLDRWSAALGRDLGEADVEPLTWQVVQAGRTVTAAQVLETLERQQQAARATARWWDREGGGHDLLLTPTTAEPGPPLGAYKQGYVPGRASAFSRVVNATGQPALSLPLGWPDDGMPRGVQLVAAHGREDVLVRVGAQLEAAVPWVHRRPPILQ
jgi:amidase